MSRSINSGTIQAGGSELPELPEELVSDESSLISEEDTLKVYPISKRKLQEETLVDSEQSAKPDSPKKVEEDLQPPPAKKLKAYNFKVRDY